MKKILSLAFMVGALVLMGAGCAKMYPTEPQPQTNNPMDQTYPTGQAPEGGDPADLAADSQPGQAPTQTLPAPKPTPKPVPSPVPTPKPVPTPTTPAMAQVNISGFAFSEANITVKAGTVVKWINKDSAPHSVVSNDGQFTSSAVLANGQSYEFKFNKPGVYSYACGLHPSMHGQVIVQ